MTGADWPRSGVIALISHRTSARDASGTGRLTVAGIERILKAIETCGAANGTVQSPETFSNDAICTNGTNGSHVCVGQSYKHTSAQPFCTVSLTVPLTERPNDAGCRVYVYRRAKRNPRRKRFKAHPKQTKRKVFSFVRQSEC